MGAQKLITGVWQTVEKRSPPHRIKPRPQRYFGTKCIRLQFEIFGKGPRSDLGPECLGVANLGGVGPRLAGAHRCDDGHHFGCLGALGDMAQNMMRRLMPHDKGNFIGILRICHQRYGKAHNRAAGFVFGLKGVRRL